jgi:hypothetical protein
MNGESGFYSAVSFLPFRRVTIQSYFDIFSYKWLRYRTDAPSYGHEFLLRADYSFPSQAFLSLRFRNTMKLRNKLFYEGTGFPMTEQKLNSIRLQINYPLNNSWNFSSRIEQTFFREKGGHASDGFLFYFDVKYTMPSTRFTADARIIHFDTEDYYSRIYSWEPDVLYSFRIPSFTGNGVRFLLNLSYKPANRVRLWFRLANTYMPGAGRIGSGYNAVDGNNLTEVKFQMSVKL